MAIEGKLKEIKDKSAELESSVREKTVGYITAAFGLVAGLAWNDAIKSLIETFFPGKSGGVFAKFGYAFLITAVVVLITRALIKSTSASARDGSALAREGSTSAKPQRDGSAPMGKKGEIALPKEKK
jgi:hypothetical protein